MFGITALKVLMMIAYGLPGYMLIKVKVLNEDSIKVFAKFLLYVCQPCLSIYSLSVADCTPRLLRDMGIFFALTLIGQILIIGLYSFIFKKKMKNDVAQKICAMAGACGNVGFLGIPVLEYLIPENPEVLVYASAFSMSMNILAWTVGLVMMTGDRKYISAKAMFANPATISFLIAFSLFAFKIKFPPLAAEYIETLGRMSTVVCMTILGMRLATKKLTSIFTNYRIYIAATSKLVIFPIIIGVLFAFIPVGQDVRSAAFILGCCPAATMIQSLAETHGGDSKTAADIVLSTSLICILTIPMMWSVYSNLFL